MAAADFPTFPWEALAPYREKALAFPGELIDLSIGTPIDPTPEPIRQALAVAANAPGYPQCVGTPALRQAITDYLARERNVFTPTAYPTIGSKEAVSLLPLILGVGRGDAVVYPRLAYPTYEIGAVLVDAKPCPEDDPDKWPDNTRLIWLNTPQNPTGRVLKAEYLRRAIARARQLGAVLVSDECYAELAWEEKALSLLDKEVCGNDFTGLLMLQSLSKQASMAGYRAGIITGDAQLLEKFIQIRKHLGLIVPLPVQAAMQAAFGMSFEPIRQMYGKRRLILRQFLTENDFTIHDSQAGLYLWATRGESGWQSLDWLAGLGALAAPGAFYGDENFVRFSTTAAAESLQLLRQRAN